MEVWISLATVLIGALATGILTYINVRARTRADVELNERRLLRDLRLPHYQRLFQVSGLIVDQPDPEGNNWRSRPRTAQTVLEEWYFNEGAGMFLTQAARERYSDLVRAFQEGASNLSEASSMSDEDARKICVRARSLRFQLTEDLAMNQTQQSGGSEAAEAGAV